MAELFNFQTTILLAVLAIFASIWKPQEERSVIIKIATIATGFLMLAAMFGWSIYIYHTKILSSFISVEQFVSIWQYFIIMAVVFVVFISVIRMMQLNRNGFI